MKNIVEIAVFLILLATTACSTPSLFSGYMKESFPMTRVTESNIKTVQLLNNSATEVQHIIGMSFYAGSNKSGHFQVTGVSVGTEKVGQKDIFVPPMGVLNIEITYAPLNLETTEAEFAGWTTRSTDRWEVVNLADFDKTETEDESSSNEDRASSIEIMSKLAKSSTKDTSIEYEPAIHRAMLIVVYDEPAEGYSHVELVGGAIPGPDGEETAVAMGGGGGGDCVAEGTKACFTGTFSIDLPGLMSGGAMETPMNGPIPITIDGGVAEINMDQFPPVLIALKGNGPGEPLEGKPVDAISIIISGTPETVATGSFDGQNLALSDVSFRIRVQLGEVTYEDINPGLTVAVDFNITDLEIVTDEPFDGSKIVFGVETTLSDAPSGNGLFDTFLGNARVVVKFSGMLDAP